MSEVYSHSHSIPRCGQAFFQSLCVCGAVSMASLGTLGLTGEPEPHWGPWAGLLTAEPAAACWPVDGIDFCGITFLVLFSVARAKPHGLLGIKTGKTAQRKAMDTLSQGTWTLDTQLGATPGKTAPLPVENLYDSRA